MWVDDLHRKTLRVWLALTERHDYPSLVKHLECSSAHDLDRESVRQKEGSPFQVELCLG